MLNKMFKHLKLKTDKSFLLESLYCYSSQTEHILLKFFPSQLMHNIIIMNLHSFRCFYVIDVYLGTYPYLPSSRDACVCLNMFA